MSSTTGAESASTLSRTDFMSPTSSLSIPKQSFFQKISDYARKFFHLAFGGLLASFNPTLFAIGFAGALVYNEEASRLAKRVNDILNSLNLTDGLILVFFVLTFFHVFCLIPTVLAGVEGGHLFANHIARHKPAVQKNGT